MDATTKSFEGQVTYYSDLPSQNPLILKQVPVRDRILFIDPRSELTRLTAGAVFLDQRFDDEEFDSIVFRGGQGFDEALNYDRTLARVGAQLPVWCLTSGGNRYSERAPRLTVPIWARHAKKPPSMTLLREIETQGILYARGSVLGGGPDHFETASGIHQERYVRIRDALLGDALDCERLADWMMAYLHSGAAVCGDRPTLIPLVQAVALLARKRLGWDVPIVTRHGRGTELAVEQLRAVGARHKLVIIGVDSRATQASDFRMLASERGGRVTTVCIADITDGQPASEERFAHIPIARWQPSKCPKCADGATFFSVDLKSEDTSPHYPRDPVDLTIDAIKADAAFWRQVHHTRAIRLHLDGPYHDAQRQQQRHRPIDIDVAALLGHPAFRRSCLEKLGDMPAPDHVIVVEHDATEALISLALQAYPGLRRDEITIATRPLSGDELDPRLVDRVLTAKRTLVLDDALITGATMLQLMDNLRAACGNQRWARVEIFGFVPLSCPSGALDQRQVANAFRRPHRRVERRFQCAKQIYLPPSDECPWCQESRLMDRLRDSVPEFDHLIDARVEALRQPVSATTMVFDHRQREVVRPPVIDAIGDAVSDGVAFAAFSSAAQKLKQQIASDDPPKAYVRLGHVIENWWGPAVFAGILRTLGQTELKYVGQEGRFREAWNRRSVALSTDELKEFAWAAILDKLTLGSIAVVQQTLQSRQGQDPVLDLMAELLRVKLGPVADRATRARVTETPWVRFGSRSPAPPPDPPLGGVSAPNGGS